MAHLARGRLLHPQSFSSSLRLSCSSSPSSSHLSHLHSSHTTAGRRLYATSTVSSTTTTSAWYSLSFLLRATLVVVSGTATYLYLSDSRAGIHRWGIPPLVHLITQDDPERAHRLGVEGLKWSGKLGFLRDIVEDGKELEVKVWGRRLSNPVGMAAGFDKHGEAIDGLFDIGFGYVEIGSVTPLAQPGNPQPRMFRLPSTESMVNRYGFNSEGHYPVLARLRARVRSFVHHHALSLPSSLFLPLSSQTEAVSMGSTSATDPITALLGSPPGRGAAIVDGLGVSRSLREGKLLGINLGKNKTSDPDSVQDFVDGVQVLGPYADVVVVNISSPNTPGLRGLQRRSMLEELVSEVVKARDGLSQGTDKQNKNNKPPLLLKVAPDLTANELRDVGEVAMSHGIDGIIVSNTTTQRPMTPSTTEPALRELGGLSGPPLKPLALAALSTLYAVTEGSIPLVGCGGIRTGADALDYARAGATLVQLYTALGYQGVGLPRRIKDDVSKILKAEGKTWQEVVGSQALKPSQIAGLTTRQDDMAREWQQAVHDIELGIAAVDQRISQCRDRLMSQYGGDDHDDDGFVHQGSVPLQAADNITSTASPQQGTLAPSTAETVKSTIPHGTVVGAKTTSGFASEHGTPVELVAPPPSRPASTNASSSATTLPPSEQAPRGLWVAWKERRDATGPRKV